VPRNFASAKSEWRIASRKTRGSGAPATLFAIRYSPTPPSPQIQFLEKIIALVIDHDECRKILDLDAPDRLHAELGIFHRLDLLDAVLGEVRRRAADRGEIEAAVFLAGFAHRARAVALGEHDHRAAGGLEIGDEGVHPSGRGRA